MNFNDWKKRFIRALKGISEKEKLSAVDYYKELYADKIEAGKTCEQILQEFGSPEDCAYKIMQDGTTLTIEKQEVKVENTSVRIVGLVFITLFLTIPFGSILFSIVVTFGSLALSGIIFSISGVLCSIFSPIYFAINGGTFAIVLFSVSLGIALIGVGILLFIGFYYATKYLSILCIKLFKFVYFRRTK